LLIIIITPASAVIHNIPDDFEKIQSAIEVSQDGDTVLVAPGVYAENIDFLQKEITLASHFISEADENLICETIIDGGENDSVVTMIEGNNNPVLIGFTIRNGLCNRGGGIECDSTNDTFLHLLVTENVARQIGGGVYFRDCSPTLNHIIISNNSGQGASFRNCNATVRDVIIDGNRSEGSCGGISLGNCQGLFEHIIISNNIAENDGGGLYYYSELPPPTFNNIAVYGNQADDGGGIYLRDESGELITFNHLTLIDNHALMDNHIHDEGGGIALHRGVQLELTNSILYLNEPAQVCAYISNDIFVNYSNIQGGQEGIDPGRNQFFDLEWGEGNISTDPLLRENYHLSPASPCIDTGDPESEPDSDGTRADMGAFSFLDRAVLTGHVYDAENDTELAGVAVSTTNGELVVSNDEGYWALDPARASIFDITASLQGYNSQTFEGLELRGGDTIDIDFNLTHPEFFIEPEGLETDVIQGETLEFALPIANDGNGELVWSSNLVAIAPRPFVPFGIFEDIQVQLNEGVLLGGGFSYNGLHYLSWWANMDFRILGYNREGNLIDQIELPSRMVNNSSWIHLTTDGESIWTTCSGELYEIDFFGSILFRQDLRIGQLRGVAYDDVHELLWVVDNHNIIGFDTNNYERLHEFEIEERNIRSITFWADDPDGQPFYMLSQFGQRENNLFRLEKFNMETFENVVVWEFWEREPYGDIFISDGIDPGRWILQMVKLGEPVGARLWHLDFYAHWLSIEPDQDVILPEHDGEVFIIMETENCNVNTKYEANVIFSHNAVGGEVIIPIEMNVLHPESASITNQDLPNKFSLSNPYPNPFNSSITIEYSIPRLGYARLSILDLHGREIAVLHDGTQTLGYQKVTWDAGDQPSGIYLCRLESVGRVVTTKLTLIK